MKMKLTTTRRGAAAMVMALALLLVSAGQAGAQASFNYWNKTGDGNWNEAGSWNRGEAPNGSYIAVINNGYTVTIGDATTAEADYVALDSSGSGSSSTLVIDGSTLVIDGGTLKTYTGGISLGDSGGTSGVLQIGNGGAAGLIASGSSPTASVEIAGDGDAAANQVIFNHNNSAYYFTHDGTDATTANIIGLDSYEALSVVNEQGTTILTGKNLYQGDTTVNGGTLRIGGSGVLGYETYYGSTDYYGEYNGKITIADGAFFEVDTDKQQQFQGDITGAGTFAVLKDRLVVINGSGNTVDSKVALYEGSIFRVRSGSSAIDIPTLEVRGKNATYAHPGSGSPLTMGAGDTINFYVPADLAAGDTMLKVAVLGEGPAIPGTANITGAEIGVFIERGKTALAAGDLFTLIDAGGGLTSDHDAKEATVIEGISKSHSAMLSVADNKLQATVDGSGGGGASDHVEAQLKSLPETQVASVGALTQGTDLVTTQGIGQLRTQTVMGTAGPASFGVTSGGSTRYNSGSHVDVDGFSLSTGLGWNFPLNGGANGDLLLGAFFEAGWSSYTSHNSFANAPAIEGEGDTKYYGGGLMARYDAKPAGPGHIYVEGSVRAGRVESDYESSDFIGVGRVRYDSAAPYHGVHAGLGYIWNVTEATDLDMYAKYLWTHQGGDSVRIAGDKIEFEAIDSHRLRAGARLSHTVDTASDMVFSPYIGAAYDHEFDSVARSKTNGKSIKAPEVKGGTGMGEIGFVWKPSQSAPLSFDLGVQGYTGKREGVTGSLTINLTF